MYIDGQIKHRQNKEPRKRSIHTWKLTIWYMCTFRHWEGISCLTKGARQLVIHTEKKNGCLVHTIHKSQPQMIKDLVVKGKPTKY